MRKVTSIKLTHVLQLYPTLYPNIYFTVGFDGGQCNFHVVESRTSARRRIKKILVVFKAKRSSP
jgi:hypothetical protein